MEGLEIKKIALYSDDRGWLGELIREDESGFRPAMTYLSMTNPGGARGPHEHREQTDYFCFMGKFRVYLWDNRPSSPTYGESRIIDTDGKPIAVIVPPGIVHAYKNMDDRDGLVLNLPDKLYRGQNKSEPVDEIRYEDDPESGYFID